MLRMRILLAFFQVTLVLLGPKTVATAVVEPPGAVPFNLLLSGSSSFQASPDGRTLVYRWPQRAYYLSVDGGATWSEHADDGAFRPLQWALGNGQVLYGTVTDAPPNCAVLGTRSVDQGPLHIIFESCGPEVSPIWRVFLSETHVGLAFSRSSPNCPSQQDGVQVFLSGDRGETFQGPIDAGCTGINYSQTPSVEFRHGPFAIDSGGGLHHTYVKVVGNSLGRDPHHFQSLYAFAPAGSQELGTPLVVSESTFAGNGGFPRGALAPLSLFVSKGEKAAVVDALWEVNQGTPETCGAQPFGRSARVGFVNVTAGRLIALHTLGNFLPSATSNTTTYVGGGITRDGYLRVVAQDSARSLTHCPNPVGATSINSLKVISFDELGAVAAPPRTILRDCVGTDNLDTFEFSGCTIHHFNPWSILPDGQAVGAFSFFDGQQSSLWFQVASRIALVDPAQQLKEGLTLSGGVEEWAQSVELRHGVTADDTTRLVIRIPAADITGADLSIDAEDGLAGDIGQLLPISSPHAAGMSALSVAPTVTETGPFIFALYRAPRNFVRFESDREARHRTVILQAELQHADEPVATEFQILVRRPPLVLLHGLFGSAEDTFAREFTRTLEAQGARTVIAWDYSPMNALPLAANVLEPRHAVGYGLDLERSRGFGATRADVAAHSMGSLITRLYMQSPGAFHRADNYWQGDVNRLISINTPHRGTPVADLLSEMNATCKNLAPSGSSGRLLQQVIGCGWLNLIERLISKQDNGFKLGAVDDLRWSSPQISQLEESPVASHALTSTVGFLDGLEAFLWSHAPIGIPSVYCQITGKEVSSESAFCQLPHDWIVPIISQEGRLNFTATSSLGDLSHSQVTKRVDTAAAIDALLSSDTSEPSWSFFGANFVDDFCPGANIASCSLGPPDRGSTQGEILPSITITTPMEGVEIQPGDTINIMVEPNGVAEPFEIAYVATDLIEVVPGSSTSTAVQVPVDFTSEKFMIAAAIIKDGLVVTFDGPVQLPVVLANKPVRLELEPTLLNLEVGETRRLRVTGVYDDDVPRDLTSASRGSTYLSADETVVTAEPTGQVTANGPGLTRVSVSNGNLARTAPVFVREARRNQRPSAEAGMNRTLECSGFDTSVVELDGTDSSDPDGDTLSCQWSSDACAFEDQRTCATNALCPLGESEVSLVVNDSALDSEPDSIVVNIEDQTPPAVAAAIEPKGSDTPEVGKDRQLVNFVVNYSVEDRCDPDPEIEAVLDFQCGAVRTSNGQALVYQVAEQCKVELRNKILQIVSPGLLLRVTGTDQSGNAASAMDAIRLRPD